MSKRLQVLIPEAEYAAFKRHAKSAKMSVGAWVRGALRRVTDSESPRSVDEKLRALNRAVANAEPVASVEQMKAEIRSGYLK